MKIIKYDIGVALMYPTVHFDNRGFFMESYNNEINAAIEQMSGPVEFVQDNHSMSHIGVLRGLHYQWDKPMGKLLRVVSGAIWDVIVDIRHKSDYYGQHYKFLLSDTNRAILWVPPGFAQGFVAMKAGTHLCYKTTALHNPNAEGAINPFDSYLNINWNEFMPKDWIVMSDKDAIAPTFSDYNINPRF